MDEQKYFNETEYIEGFNIGYKMTKDFPEFAEILDHTRGQSDKLDGLKDGREQYLEEQLKEKTIEQTKSNITPSWLKDDRLENLDREIDKDQDKDIEPDL